MADVSRLSNSQLVTRIRELGIDILVECDGHFRKGVRLPLFAARAAPVQVSLPVYPGSLAVPGLDFRITDGVVDPPELQNGYPECLLRLPLYLPWDPGPLPPAMHPRRRSSQPIVFGSFSLAAKLNSHVIDCWSAILRLVPRSRLTIQHHMDRIGSPAVNPALRRRFSSAFKRRGIDPARVDLRGALPHAECMALHNSVDIALDPFPYNGTLTSLSALSMQTPMVTLAGSTSAGRVGMSILSAVGLDSLIAHDVEQYIRIAVEVAGSPGDRARCGRTIRDAMASSRWDPAACVGELEAAYEEAWDRRDL